MLADNEASMSSVKSLLARHWRVYNEVIDMNTVTQNSNPSIASGIHPGIWIGGGLMSLAIVALATTLVMKSNDAASTSALPVGATNATTQQSSATNSQSGVSPQPVPVYEAARPVHHVPAPVHHEPARYNDAPQQVFF